MAISLNFKDRNAINQKIQTEHLEWVKNNIPAFLTLNISSAQYSLLDYPELWSGSRLFETKIEKLGKDRPANEVIEELIKQAKKDHKKDADKIQKLDAFATQYTKYQALLKERCLLKAINQTLKEIEGPKKTPKNQVFKTITEDFEKELNASALINMQTRHDCLMTHRKITIHCYELKSKTKADQHQKIKQLEVLSKRLLDSHYKNAKKSTITESLANDLSTITSFAGLSLGVTSATLAIIGIFVPPLLPIAGLIGTIGFISYVASAISAANMLMELAKYNRGPSRSDFLWLVFDIVAAPLYIVGGQLFSALSNAVKSLNTVHTTVKEVGNIWNNIASNLIPDIFFAKETTTDLFTVGATFTPTGKLDNTPTATSWEQIGSALSKRNKASFDTIVTAEKDISLLNQHKARPKASQQHQETLKQLNDLACLDIASEKPLQSLKTALQAYIDFEKNVDYKKKYRSKEQYEQEIYRKDFILAVIEQTCDQLTNLDEKQEQWRKNIKKLANDLHKELGKDHDTYTKAKELSTTALKGRDFVYTKINQNAKQDGPLTIAKSLHAHILLWDKGFIGTTTSQKAQLIKDAVAQYKALAPDTDVTKRIQCLQNIQQACGDYLGEKDNQSKGRYNFVKTLNENITKELDVLLDFTAADKNLSTVLVGFTSTPG